MRSPSVSGASHAEGFLLFHFNLPIYSLQAPWGDRKSTILSPHGACLPLIGHDILVCSKYLQELSDINYIYDSLIKGIPECVTASFVAVGPHITIVESDGFTGIAGTVIDENRPRTESAPYSGKSLRSLAELIYSWNFTEASIGLAAICAFYNRTDTGVSASFRYLKRETSGKYVVITKQAPYITKHLSDCQLSAVSRTPEIGEFLYTATEELCPKADYVILDGDAIVSKELPHLMEISKSSELILAGFGVPLSDVFRKQGISTAALCVTDIKRCRELALAGVEASEMLSVCTLVKMEVQK